MGKAATIDIHVEKSNGRSFRTVSGVVMVAGLDRAALSARDVLEHIILWTFIAFIWGFVVYSMLAEAGSLS